jgi:hypothetical protein
MEPNNVAHILGLSCRPDQRLKLDTWFTERHIKDLLKFKGLQRATHFELLYPGRTYPGYPKVDYPQFFTIYEFNSQKDFEAYEASPELKASFDNVREVWSKDPFQRVWRAQFKATQTWENK